ncbi:hypothetical protein H5410_020769 [Solanum commersonii]|uniref:DUF4283 domain-containing protein n=1 Tax=Solanum commersonii TaxID=4109 RepID=A0A9J5ZC94_SOLCO|nr:hypothetical protein H5410_020769 [Solanum commersonii]
MAIGRGRGKGRPRRANEARLELEGKKKVTPAATHARGTLTDPTSIYATDRVKKLHLSTRATTSKTEPVIATVQQKCEVSTNDTVTGAPPITTTKKGKAPIESWANLFAKNRSVTNVYVLGESPGYNTVHRYISQTWTEVVAPEIFMHEEGYFINWTEDFDVDQEFPAKIPIWVKFPNLPMNCWGCDSLSRIASAIGIPMFADECTTKQMRISFARMLVEVDVTKPLLDKINVMDPTGKTIVQGVKYNWKPIFCQKCQVVGHECLHEQSMRCRRALKKVVQKWISKEVVKPVVTTANEVPKQATSPTTGTSGVITYRQPSPNLTLENFPMLQPTPVRNRFSPLSMLWDERDIIHPDKGYGANVNCYLTVVYGYNTGDKRKELWINLRDLAIRMTAPWLICGDFYALLYAKDRLYGNPSLKQRFAKLNQEEFKAVTQRLNKAKTDLVNIHEQVVLQCTDGL